MLQKVKHSKVLPSYLSSLQIANLGRAIHDHVSEAVTPLVEANPQYQAITLTLGQLEAAVDQLNTAHAKRKFKSSKSLRGVGGHDGRTQKYTLSHQKRDAYEKRKVLMKRFRYVLNWRLEEAEADHNLALLDAAEVIDKHVYIRIDDFEDGNYADSKHQFDHFFKEMDADPEALDALPVLHLTKAYADMRAAHREFNRIHTLQTEQDAKLEKAPMIRSSSDEVRQVAKVLLTMIHFDVSTGNQVLEPVLGHLDEMIDKERASAKTRRTAARKEAAAKAAGSQSSGDDQASDGQPSTEGDQASADDQASEGSGGSVASGSSGGSEGEGDSAAPATGPNG